MAAPRPADTGAGPDDEWLAVRCRLGERAAFDELIQRWNDPLWRYLRRVVPQDRDPRELVQEVWLRVIRGISRLREPARLRPWLFGIARRVAMDTLREHYAAPHTEAIDSFDPPATGFTDTLHEDLAAMEEELRRLPVIEREVLTLAYLRELSMEQVAEVLGVPVGTVKSRLFRARRMLRNELIEKGHRS